MKSKAWRYTVDRSKTFETELPPDLAAFVHAQVEQGVLASEADVLREGVRALQRQAWKVAEMRAMVNASINDPRPSLSAEDVAAHLDELDHGLNPRGDHA